ncbi:FdhF/YdeP family oxidoreductase [Planctomicrobium piriforme]|uniref:Oxidoreductase alpha (Molybdopterin) subunit n=1 Tax=Planctomicrobium piriforme TaxID=1576369 RepID=A0A1I3TDD4_9PLAN|nr:FdhF/YdeP family oxidoreductase [Planctomicrobium piriforme]SFJ68523.1 oxidoreductase alpha (molybdopterin) subunit [Planctomicrobium piriforme]
MEPSNYRPEPKPDEPTPETPETQLSLKSEHGPVQFEHPEHPLHLKQHAPEKKATGLPAVLNSFYYSWSEAGLIRGTLPLLQLNQKNGFDCPGCAWPDPDGKRSAFDFCENGAKAVAHESDQRRLTADFFAKNSIAHLSRESDYWLEQQGRLTEPMVLRPGATHYKPISWDDAFALIAEELNGLDSPNEAAFYTSGKATNEAAFAYQLFVRQFGTNNLPDCSNMCHESSGAALSKVFGFGKGTVKLEDFKEAELVFVVGQNPGTNHPRQLTALQESKRHGARIISVNPLPETGLMSFMNPQEPSGMLGIATKLTDLFLQVKINGDVPLFKGLLKRLVEWEDEQPGSTLNWDYIHKHTTGIDELLADVRTANWDDIVAGSGISRDQIETAASWVKQSERIIICWCLGVTQHRNGTQNVQEMMNLLMLKGSIAKPGAGPCCVRGHSNVQGDRTMGVWERPKAEFLDKLAKAFSFEPPREHGADSQKTVLAMHEGRVKVLVSLGGNFLMALSDTRFTAEALQKTRLTVRIGTKLNRADLVTGRQSLILPCLGRTEEDLRPATPTQPARVQFTSTENSMGVVQWSTGRFAPASTELLGEPDIICRMANAVLGTRTTIDWLAWADEYDNIRDGIAKVIPGCENYNRDVRLPGGFYLPNPPRENRYPTPTGKALFTVNPLPRHQLQPGQLAMTTVRSHDQFNTTIYGLHDRYRGLHYERRVVMMHADDIKDRGLKPLQKVDVTSHFEDQQRTAHSFVVVEYPIPRGNAAMYYPEANVLIPIGSTDSVSNCPTFKHTVITVAPAKTVEL